MNAESLIVSMVAPPKYVRVTLYNGEPDAGGEALCRVDTLRSALNWHTKCAAEAHTFSLLNLRAVRLTEVTGAKPTHVAISFGDGPILFWWKLVEPQFTFEPGEISVTITRS